MQSLLVELEHFRELLKYVWTWACLKFRFGSRHYSSSVSAAIFRLLVPIRFCSSQAHSFLYLALDRDTAQSCSSSVFGGREASHGTDSASPLNPFIGTENRIIWLSVLCPQVRNFFGCGIWHPLCADFAAAGSGRYFFRKICSQLLHSYNALSFRFVLFHIFGAFPSS